MSQIRYIFSLVEFLPYASKYLLCKGDVLSSVHAHGRVRRGLTSLYERGICVQTMFCPEAGFEQACLALARRPLEMLGRPCIGGQYPINERISGCINKMERSHNKLISSLHSAIVNDHTRTTRRSCTAGMHCKGHSFVYLRIARECGHSIDNGIWAVVPRC